ncbi:phosphonate ABC transporter, periplasmic phosphonate-binding protein [Magnetococcus marinus MC-1]|uniref:Phosphonate ABC transporter, periplasmic phosphonate-binding protein n=1 Tax=Magnetococcus marinus (strain ATCC BAA-1437 / JCM 17883 / MC-1) TaxID=156889 RepID=A0LD47_MAGMM|nr:phosphate/phosphite/phosphonate ABC transporter substrate-binding protein [Magnetococcus marinus]ABK45890.1 phosphonate ABC transporter, periplasmic phosphonate-binding protein [Magnetococcus marinus MC-1]
MVSRLWMALLCGLLNLLLATPSLAQTPLIFGVHPFLPATELHKRFQPLITFLMHELQRPVQFHVAANYAEHLKNLVDNQIDIAYLGPYPYIKLVHDFTQPRLLAQLRVNGENAYHGVIFTYEKASLQSLADLRGKRMAFGDVDSTMSHLIPLKMLQQAGVKKVDLGGFQHVNNHLNVVYGVLTGLFDAGATKESTYHQYAAWGLRVLARSPAVPNHVLVARATLPNAHIEAVKAALAKIGSGTLDTLILKPLKPNITGLGPVTDADFDGLRRLLSVPIPQRGQP